MNMVAKMVPKWEIKEGEEIEIEEISWRVREKT